MHECEAPCWERVLNGFYTVVKDRKEKRIDKQTLEEQVFLRGKKCTPGKNLSYH